MREVSRSHVIRKLQSTNPWWDNESDEAVPFSDLVNEEVLCPFPLTCPLATPVRGYPKSFLGVFGVLCGGSVMERGSAHRR